MKSLIVSAFTNLAILVCAVTALAAAAGPLHFREAKFADPAHFSFTVANTNADDVLVESTSDLVAWGSPVTVPFPAGVTQVEFTDASESPIPALDARDGRFYRAHGTVSGLYSDNIIGYVRISAPSGFIMVAHQLNSTPDNTLASIMASVPENTQVYKFDGASGGYYSSMFSADNPGWSNPSMTLNPGEGAFLHVDPAFAGPGATLDFVGEVRLVSALPLRQGPQVISSVIPQKGPIDRLGYVPAEGDMICQFRHRQGTYDCYQWSADNPGWSTLPVIDLGESFFLFRSNFGAQSWNRVFQVGP
jgi:hypothetical protein